MKENLKYILGILAAAIGIYLLWYFKAIVFFVLVSAILSLVTRPLFDFFQGMGRDKSKWRFALSKGWSALATVLLLWMLILGLGSYVVPFVVEEMQFLSTVDFNLMLERLEQTISPVVATLQESMLGDIGFPMIKEQMSDFWVSIFNIGKLQEMVASVVDFVGSVFIALFSISFITFFLLKDEWLLMEGIKLFVPEVYYVGVDHMLWSINRLLRRYFIGIIIQISLISAMITIGLLAIGLEFKHALIIGLFSGFINIIPYLGPVIAVSFGMIVSLMVYLQMTAPPVFFLYFGAILVLYVLVQLMDNIVFQPAIFSSSVKAHPLEIFLVIIMAGYMAGMAGMFMAIPVYTIIRVVAKEFFSKYNLVKKLTGKLD
ncbi:AI-2E family transporter [Saccharicrinis fermentans]|uniref:Sporulation integral membrane protein YtvI n=1 Tax=Saccharicrinis fermentans DSM 9555 = JCM 21142 TaxID=869213 RepID=W7Y290_9BACT|nr:AI-2E family transporter [Saccharicrinis fermentans]GAF01648.1 sporulation integral membrane protein YtvI [Saccharicrinis fermentans DSM 9555 = JCM 21142]